MESKPPMEKNLFRVIMYGSALSFAMLGAIVGSMKDFLHGEAALSFSWKTVIGFVVGFVVGLLPWKWVERKMTNGE